MTDNRVYLDYSATCPMDPQVNEAVYQWNRRHRGNPSSPHRFGQEAKIKLEETRDILAETAGCLPAEIIFTSGGTESNNLALIGTARALASRGKHIIVSAVEHPSVLECCAFLQRTGFDISYVAPDAQGFLDPSSIRSLIKSDTILVSIMYVNNETGIIHPVAEIGQLCRDRGVLFHCDAVQALGKIPFAFNELPVDMMSISGHKIYGPTGIGALIVKKGTPLENLHFGGGQEAARRPGTENMSGVVGLGEALRCLRNHSKEFDRVQALQSCFEERAKAIFADTRIIGDGRQRSPFISCLAFPGLDNQSLLLNLDLAGIAVSVGSACSSGSIKQSHVLTAMGLTEAQIKGALRFSFGRYTTSTEMDYTLEQLQRIFNNLYG